MNLYHVQDDERAMYVAAESLGHAVRRWRDQISRENPDELEIEEPNGVTLLATGSDPAHFPEILFGDDSHALVVEIVRRWRALDPDRADKGAFVDEVCTAMEGWAKP